MKSEFTMKPETASGAMNMNSRERVLTAFKHQTPDRVPLDFVAVPELSAALIRHLQLSDHDELLKRLHVDFRHLDKWGTMVPKYIGPELPKHANGTTEDMWGCRLKKVEYQPGCFYEEHVDPPLANATSVADVERHCWPNPDCFDFSDVEKFCRLNDPYCLVGGLGATLNCVGFFRGMEQAMIDIYENPAVFEAITEKLFEFKYEYNARLLAAAKGRLDILMVSEDMGGQNGLLVSKETLRRFVFPILEKFAEQAHKHNAMAMLHSDGAIREILPDLIDLGIEIINPVQISCPGMEPAALKRDFGDKLVFHGLLDSQELLPFSTPQQVLDEVRRIVEVTGGNGGIALSPNCGFQIDVPIENILTLYDNIGAV